MYSKVIMGECLCSKILCFSFTCLNICCCSVAPSCLTLCDPMDCIIPSFPVLHCLLEFAQTHVRWVDDTIQPSHPLSPIFSSCSQSFPASGSFPVRSIHINIYYYCYLKNQVVFLEGAEELPWETVIWAEIQREIKSVGKGRDKAF